MIYGFCAGCLQGIYACTAGDAGHFYGIKGIKPDGAFALFVEKDKYPEICACS